MNHVTAELPYASTVVVSADLNAYLNRQLFVEVVACRDYTLTELVQ
jgi:hypothetical protein